ncbi:MULTISPECIES: DUF4234 domain-containing protein [unclassified Frankia]|uniref:DUF4234 domain-containing protein n=1 Tax=unclassified Frankia TaxID=2632575 RepID=UPI002AD455B5|nr:MULTISPECIES: DUF4234 domain-containing protein [unclassified Frankia]
MTDLDPPGQYCYQLWPGDRRHSEQGNAVTEQTFGPYGQSDRGRQPSGLQRVNGYGPPRSGRAYPTSATAVPSGYPQPTATGIHGKRRNPCASWLGLPLITLGIYTIVWIYKTNKELSEYDRRIVVDPTLSVFAVTLGVLLLAPPLVAVWRLCARTRQAQQSAGLPPLRTGVAFTIFLLGFGPLNLQSEINRIWDRYPTAVEGQQVPLPA